MIDATKEPAAQDIADSIFGPEHGPIIRSALMMLYAVPQEVFNEAARRADHARAFGCFTDPTAWIKAEATKNPAKWQEFLHTLASFRHKMELIK